ncbi:MAG TPA: hypothetical protein VIH47_06400 [Solirubrobacterales bacterium]
MLKKRVASLLAVAAIGLVGAAGGASAQPISIPTSVQTSAACSPGYVHAVLPDGSKCLHSGEYCSHKPGYAEPYRQAGFRCDAEGRLVER